MGMWWFYVLFWGWGPIQPLWRSGKDVDTYLLSSIPVGACVCLVNLLSMSVMWMIAMKRCEMLGSICPVCLCMRVRFWDMPSSPSRYAGSWFVLGFVCWSVLLYEVLGLPCALFFCVFVFWCLVMSSPAGAGSLIGHRVRIYVLSYLSRYDIVWCGRCLSVWYFVVFLVLFLFMWVGK